MEIEDRNILTTLYDTYGKLLSEKEEKVMEIYLNQDLGESEIAELSGETRQSVYDAIKKAKIKLNGFEHKCGFLSKRRQIVSCIDELKQDITDESAKEKLEKMKTIL